MSYVYRDPSGSSIEVCIVGGQASVFVDEDTAAQFPTCATGSLPTEATDVQALIEAILAATGFELRATAKTMMGPVTLGEQGIAKLVKS